MRATSCVDKLDCLQDAESRRDFPVCLMNSLSLNMASKNLMLLITYSLHPTICFTSHSRKVYCFTK